jgi:hypothetical protein
MESLKKTVQFQIIPTLVLESDCSLPFLQQLATEPRPIRLNAVREFPTSFL